MTTPKAPSPLPDLNNAGEPEPATLAIPHLLSLLKSAFERSDLAEAESVLNETLVVKQVELRSICEALSERCSDLEQRLGLKHREAEGLRAELVAKTVECGALKERVSQLEKGRMIEISDSDESGEGFVVMPPALRRRRRRSSRVVTSDSEREGENVPVSVQEEEEEEDADDDVPIGKLRGRRLRGDHRNPSRKRLVRSGEHNTTLKHGKEGTPVAVDSSVNSDYATNRSAKRPRVHRQLLFPEDSEACSGSEDSSMDGFIVQGSGSDDQRSKSSGEADSSATSEDNSSSDVDLDDVISSLRRKKDVKEWQYESDMLASFAESPEVCMKAICALYRQQTVDEQSTKGTIYANSRGFSQADAHKASMIAEFLLDGDAYGPPRKSLEEFKKCYPSGPQYCRKIADRYSKQLFAIYEQGEDDFFGPS